MRLLIVNPNTTASMTHKIGVAAQREGHACNPPSTSTASSTWSAGTSRWSW